MFDDATLGLVICWPAGGQREARRPLPFRCFCCCCPDSRASTSA